MCHNQWQHYPGLLLHRLCNIWPFVGICLEENLQLGISECFWEGLVYTGRELERDGCVFLLRQSQKQNLDLSRQEKFASTPSFALFITLKNVVCKIGEDAEVLMSLYDPVKFNFIR